MPHGARFLLCSHRGVSQILDLIPSKFGTCKYVILPSPLHSHSHGPGWHSEHSRRHYHNNVVVDIRARIHIWTAKSTTHRTTDEKTAFHTPVLSTSSTLLVTLRFNLPHRTSTFISAPNKWLCNVVQCARARLGEHCNITLVMRYLWSDELEKDVEQ